jgi:chemotaxis protein CheZ
MPQHPDASRQDVLPARIDTRVRELHARLGDQVPLSEIGSIVASILGSIQGDVSAHDLRVYGELEALAQYIARAKHEISTIRCDDIRTKHIPVASGELDAIASHLEEATGVILDACEQLEAVGRDLGGDAEARIGGVVTRVYEACSFQDITGQRITKVIQTLKTIETRIERLLVLLGAELATSPEAPPFRQPEACAPDARLLNGPQLAGAGNSQAEIDALLAAFG